MALESWLQGKEISRPVQSWFAESLPATSEAPDRVQKALGVPPKSRERGQLLWLGGEALEGERDLTLHTSDAEVSIPGSEDEIAWMAQLLDMARASEEPLLVQDAIDGFPGDWRHFEPRWRLIRELGLLIV